jgi:hypothetical protein
MKRVRIDPRAIYATRSLRIRAALPAERSEFCEQSCYAARGGDPSLCDGGSCWALSLGASSRPLQLERGRTPAPRPRSIAALARNYYTNTTNQGGSR